MDDYLLSKLSISKEKSPDKNHQRNRHVYLNSAPKGLKEQFDELFTQDAIEFMVDLIIHFDERIERLYSDRLRRKAEFNSKPKVPRFQTLEGIDWKVSPVGEFAIISPFTLAIKW